MKVYRSIDELPAVENAVVTIGTFDGVHKGHQKIIDKLKEISKQVNGPSVLISFDPHPRFVINPDNKSLRLLTTIEERLNLLEHYGLDIVLLIPFTKDFSNVTPEKFIENYLLSKLNPSTIVIGYDHRFGKDRTGDISLLKKYAEKYRFEVIEISKQTLEDIAISSTKIRDAIKIGHVDVADQLLGHNYFISGYVVKGKNIGNTIGFPTANIELTSDYKMIPREGVYAVKVTALDKSYSGMLNIGHRPTFEGENKTIEVNIFEFNKNIYGELIRIEIIKMIRNEEKFDSADSLKVQLAKDKINAMRILSELNKH